MAVTMNGTYGVKWGISTTMTGTGVGTFLPQSSTFSKEADEVEVKDGDGNCVTDIFHNQRQNLRMEITPSGATIAAAKAANIIPKPGTIITVVDTNDDEVEGTNGGKFICVRAEKASSNTDAAKINVEMKQYVDNDVAVAVGAGA